MGVARALARYRLWRGDIHAATDPHVLEELNHRRPFADDVARALHALATNDNGFVVTTCGVAAAVIAAADGEAVSGCGGGDAVYVLPPEHDGAVTCVRLCGGAAAAADTT